MQEITVLAIFTFAKHRELCFILLYILETLFLNISYDVFIISVTVYYRSRNHVQLPRPQLREDWKSKSWQVKLSREAFREADHHEAKKDEANAAKRTNREPIWIKQQEERRVKQKGVEKRKGCRMREIARVRARE